jgi:type IV pilus assembly protein PilP
MRVRSLPAVLASVAALLLSACSSAPAPGPLGSQTALGTSPPASVAAERERPLPLTAIDEVAIVEGDASRDPFRSFPQTTTPTPDDSRPRKSRRYALDELHLIGLVTGTGAPRAMLVDPRGKGWIVSPGDLVGRAETVRAGAGERAVSWRVDRIRENELVLVRDDVDQGARATTRVLALQQAPLLQQDD